MTVGNCVLLSEQIAGGDAALILVISTEVAIANQY